MLNLVLLLLGFIPLIYGANLLVDSASSLAKKLNVPSIIIGLTIIAFGTSAPELTINIFASLKGNSDIVLGNIVGSNIFNIAGILGISAIIYPLAINKKTTWIEIPLCFLAALVVFVIASDGFIDGDKVSVIKRTDGIILLLFFAVFIGYIIRFMMSSSYTDDSPAAKQHSVALYVVLIIIGLVLLVVGGRIIVLFAIKFAHQIGLSERIIALTVVSIGTSFPELATNIIAAKKRNIDLAVGNIIGSNIFNAFFVLGISAVISPVFVHDRSFFDLCVNLFISFLLFLFIFTGKGRKIDRWEGIIFVILYIGYIVMLFKMP
ncbi:MAG: calcium/sodium antiporter [Spirochaetes bacterium]|nr:calcium/sodium antiporter [Spirochaetota bacterium]